MSHITPKKSLGQNFLIDNNILRKIVDSFYTESGDLVIEIGPGEGALTQYLIERDITLLAVEKDHRSVEYLKTRFPTKLYPNFHLLEADFLDLNIPDLLLKFNYPKKLKFIGNLPYYISSQILFKLFENVEFIEKANLMFQKEVAKRLVASPRTKDYGILTLALKLVGAGKILFDVSPMCFRPIPKVYSSILEINFSEDLPYKNRYKNIIPLIRAAFNQRRKKLCNSLKTHIESQLHIAMDEFISIALEHGLDVFAKRAEELTEIQFGELENIFSILKIVRDC